MSLLVSAQSDWTSYGDVDPYFGVLANEKFKSAHLNADAIDEFFATGVSHVENVLAVAKDRFGYTPRGRALDFGCGVGRLTNAFAAHFDDVIGLDIAPGMLARARIDSKRRGVDNVVYKSSLDPDGLRPETYDFVHSFIVLQHIPTKVGERIIRDLLSATKPGGIGAIHFTYGHAGDKRLSALRNVVKKTPIVRNVGNLLAGRRYDAPVMQMNCYSIPRVIEIFSEAGIESLHILRIDDWGHLGLFVFFEKRRSESMWSNPKPKR